MKKLDLEWISLMQKAKEIGLSLEEVRRYIEQSSDRVFNQQNDKIV